MRELLRVVFSCSNSKTWKDLRRWMPWRLESCLFETILSLKDARGVYFSDDSVVVFTELALSEPFLLKPDPSIFSMVSCTSSSSLSIFCMETKECVYSSELSRGTSVPLLLAKEGMKFSVSLNENSSVERKLACMSIIQKLQSIELPRDFNHTIPTHSHQNIILHIMSRREGTHRTHGLVACLQTQGLLHLVGNEFCVFGQVRVAFDSLAAGQLDYLEAVVAAVHAAHAGERAGEDAVFETTGAVLAGLVHFSQFAVDAERRAEGPATCVAVEVGESTGLDGVPLVDAHGGVAGSVGAPVALAAFLQEIHCESCCDYLYFKKNLQARSYSQLLSENKGTPTPIIKSVILRIALVQQWTWEFQNRIIQLNAGQGGNAGGTVLDAQEPGLSSHQPDHPQTHRPYRQIGGGLQARGEAEAQEGHR